MSAKKPTAREWIRSPAGKAALKKAIKDADESEQELRKARRIPPEVWLMPIGNNRGVA